MKDRAYCKINLALDVVGKRDNGYHDLRSIMVPCDFYDEIELIKNEDMVYNALKRPLYFDDNNTIVKALKIMKNNFDIKDNFIVNVNKTIPIKAGLAGGSSDGASIIRIINKMYKLNLDSKTIKELCLMIGSDVLFNYYNLPALVEGTGDKLEFIDIKDDYYVLIIKPKTGVSTKECYAALDLNDCIHPNIDLIKEKLENGEEVKELLANSLQKPAMMLCKDIEKALFDLKEAGSDFAMVSGSGSSVFCIDEDENKLNMIRNNLKNQKYFIRSTKILKNREIINNKNAKIV